MERAPLTLRRGKTLLALDDTMSASLPLSSGFDRELFAVAQKLLYGPNNVHHAFAGKGRPGVTNE
jgi:hypothetical protein